MDYSVKEEKFNVISHGIGFLLSIIGLIILLTLSKSTEEFIASLIFGSCMAMLYAASAGYHAAKNSRSRKKLRIMDHAAIYLLIAGTYTPIAMISLPDILGNLVLLIIWCVALSGIILKLFFTGRFKIVSTVLYVGMGWMAFFVVKPLTVALPTEALLWLLFGGISYTLGAVFYMIKKIPMNHAIFHCFVMGGSFSHFMCMALYVI